jgi:hypothetical protein
LGIAPKQSWDAHEQESIGQGAKDPRISGKMKPADWNASVHGSKDVICRIGVADWKGRHRILQRIIIIIIIML